MNNDLEEIKEEEGEEVVGARKNLQLGDVAGKLSKKPYSKAIEQLRKLDESKTPMQKIQCLNLVTKEMVNAVTEFWEGIPIKESKLVINGEEFLMIFTYIVTQCKLKDLFAQAKLANDFTTPHIRKTKQGYCLQTLQSSLDYLLDISKEDL